MYRGPILFPLVLIVLGILLLASNLGYIQFDFWLFITTWWPLLLIIGGLDILIGSLRTRHVKARTLALDLGGAAQADVTINFGAGDLTIGKAAPGRIVDGTFEGEVRYDAKPDGRVWLKLEPLNWWGWSPRGYRWNVGLTDAVPLNLTLDGGAANTNADLTDLKVSDLRVKTGASSTTIRLPRAAGLTTVRINAGAASVKLFVPEAWPRAYTAAWRSDRMTSTGSASRSAAATTSRPITPRRSTRSIFNLRAAWDRWR